ncbi:hypothetical protein QO003_001981 [Arthrobacter silviterrae]|uniref:DUF2797 domain-containing protein n=1 Tax=Arthrobacter silviterrae TaxID=2026658 RepID=A0ABX0DI37_9MICC|nr:DUF2797 domain-containing protein [Arthrobacter silviterrae]MDQ0277678.1 hypothetical protein [Arthrobacter silviterrae]NGN84275.1 DUF2797 domain-containing protein [Arthrobacter silviterrae]
MAETGPALVRGVSWTPAGPSLSLTADDGGARVPLQAGQWLRFSVLAGSGIPARYCLGYSSVQGPEESQHFPCPSGAAAERGYQCGACFARDDFRFMHDFHRSGIAPPGLKAYLAQPHWLYVATFADGTTKVGTASQRSKWSRLADQGAVVARYVAQAGDGSVVRVLEDAVSANLGLTQFVRGAGKFASLLQPRPAADVEEVNRAAAAVVREFLGTQALDGFGVVSEQWERSAIAAGVAEPSQRIAYPQELKAGTHGIRLDSLLGPYALVGVDGSGTAFLADLTALKGHKILFGDYATDVPALQESLF